jgi:hypothetical protein
MAERSDIPNSSFGPPQADHSTFLEFAGFQLLAEKVGLFANGAVLLYTALDAVYGMQRGGMVAIE